MLLLRRFLPLVLVAAWTLAARADAPLYEQDPFDKITLNAANNYAVLKVQPLDLPGRIVPDTHRAGEKLTVHLVGKAQTAYQVDWSAVARIQLFEQMVLEKANDLVGEGKLEEAYDHFKLLEEKYPKMPGLNEAMSDYLYAEAKAAILSERKDYAGALAMLREAHRRNPKRPGLDKALGVTTEKLVQHYIEEEEYTAARTLLRNLAAMFRDHPVVAKWEGEFQAEAQKLLAEAKQAEQAGQLREASAACRRIRMLWPETPGAKQLAQVVHQKYPRVVVGVGQAAGDCVPGAIDDWTSRRSGRLAWRTLTEFTGPGPDGGRYACPPGELAIEQLGRQVVVRLRSRQRWSANDAVLTGYDVSRRLLAMADPRQPAYRADWAELLSGVSVEDVYQVNVDLRRGHLRPEALLQTILPPPASAAAAPGQPPVTNGPYVPTTRKGSEVCFVANPQYALPGPPRVKEVLERRYAQGGEAVRALKHGQVDVLDRVPLWLVDSLRAAGGLVVEPYGAPLVHCLVPNLHKPLPASRSFRRALAYGIHRQTILKQLTGGADLAGCRLVSGPFLPGASDEDPIAYAYDNAIEPRSYEPHLAIALATVGLKEIAARGGDKSAKPALPTLVLAHPADDLARVACIGIQHQLSLVGLKVDLRELPGGGVPRPIPSDVDFVYAELAMWEPLVDARRVLGDDGLAGGCSPYMSLALRQLDQSADWAQVHTRLRQIHRIAHEDAAVIPLWQLVDYFACHESVREVGARPITLYQNIEQWQVGFRY